MSNSTPKPMWSVPVSERLPEEKGWYHIECDQDPIPCDRAWFDGNMFEWRTEHIGILKKGGQLFWLSETPAPQQKITREEILSRVSAFTSRHEGPKFECALADWILNTFHPSPQHATKSLDEPFEHRKRLDILLYNIGNTEFGNTGYLHNAISEAMAQYASQFNHPQDSGEVEMEVCECGHTVPLEFSVTHAETGNSTCMPCHIEFLNDEEYRASRHLPDPGKMTSESLDLDSVSLMEKFSVDDMPVGKGSKPVLDINSFSEALEYFAQQHQKPMAVSFPDESDLAVFLLIHFARPGTKRYNHREEKAIKKCFEWMLKELRTRLNVVDLFDFINWINNNVETAGMDTLYFTDQNGKESAMTVKEIIQIYLTEQQNKGNG